ncbi:MAG TPA: pectate lyase [Caulobacteraceae bacterium]|jgi:PelA/Pel-15E family pectate lyase
MISRRNLVAAALAAASLTAAPMAAAQTPTRAETLQAMKRATQFMVEKVAYRGGYLWSYLPDMSRRWGELEAKPTMVWVQPPGTGTMGHLFLDAYHATGEEYYYRAAQAAADALIKGQDPSGGWNYIIDFAGPKSLQSWYDTYGANAWRMEEFQHNWKNGTFDDAGTSEAMQFLLRLYLEKKEARYKPALDKAIAFVLDSQYPIGGWPQRWPLRVKDMKDGKPDYTRYITFNDDVAGENIKFLVMVRQSLPDAKLRERVDDALIRAMNSFIVTHQGQPQPGWGLQYTLDLQPAGARSYEPKALVTHTTAANLDQLMNFYELTGDTKFLARIPEALAWLEQVKLPARVGNRTHPTFIEIGTNRPMYVHRRGSNVVNGEYYVDYSPEKTLGHYSAYRAVNIESLRRRYERLRTSDPVQVSRDSPLKRTGLVPLPRYFANADIQTSDLNSSRTEDAASPETATRAAELIRALNAQGWWPTPLRSTSNPYRGPGPKTPPPGDYSTTHVGDASDTSPYPTDNPVTGISTGTYIQNMGVLIEHLDSTGRRL